MFAQSWFQVAFPHGEHPPTGGGQLGLLALVIGDVAADFIQPELRAGFGHDEVTAAFVLVPETAVHKDNRFVFWEDNVRLSGKAFGMKAVA